MKNHTKILLAAGLCIFLFANAFFYLYTSYSKFNDLTEKVMLKFNPEGFRNLNIPRDYIYAEITSYPNKEWGGAASNAFKGNATNPMQVSMFYSPKGYPYIINKITFVYSPYAVNKKYLLADNFEELKGKLVIDGYKDVLITPYYQIRFQGKGYHVYVSSLFTEEYYKNQDVNNEQKMEASQLKAELARQLQDFLEQS